MGLIHGSDHLLRAWLGPMSCIRLPRPEGESRDEGPRAIRYRKKCLGTGKCLKEGGRGREVKMCVKGEWVDDMWLEQSTGGSVMRCDCTGVRWAFPALHANVLLRGFGPCVASTAPRMLIMVLLARMKYFYESPGSRLPPDLAGPATRSFVPGDDGVSSLHQPLV